MNDFLISHIKNVTKDEYCSQEEYRVLKDQVTNRLKTMKVTNIKIYKVKNITKLQVVWQR